MKKVLILGAVMMGSAFAQTVTRHGTISFHNRNLLDNEVAHHAPIRLNTEARSATGAPTDFASQNISVGLFWKDANGNYILANLAGNGQVASTTPGLQTAFRTTPGSEGTFQSAIEVEIPDRPAGTAVTFQIRAWMTSQGGYDLGPIRGSTGDFTIPALGGQPAGAGATPIVSPSLDGFNFQGIFVVPEPSTYALGIAGLGALAFLRRQRR